MIMPDPHLPTVHLRPPGNWINDPNGLVFHNGAYHVFFQFNPEGAQHTNMHWGHFRSEDLLRWELLPVALAPTPNGADADGVWSGNAVSTGGRIVAFYSANLRSRWWQPIASAVSSDAVGFRKARDLVIPDAPPGTVMFRDPYVWRDSTRWRMLVGAALSGGQGAALQYVSQDLRRWDYLGPFLARPPEALPGHRSTQDGWECVQFADFGALHAALVLSCWSRKTGASNAAVYIGRDHGNNFEPNRLQVFDHGPDCYAPALLHAPDGRWLAWAWIWEARDEPSVGAPGRWIDEAGWAGMLSFPRELTLDRGVLQQSPAREIEQLRQHRRVDIACAVNVGAPRHLGQIARSTEICATLVRSADGRAASGIRITTSDDGVEHLDVYLDPDSGDVVADRSKASRDHRAKKGSWSIPTAVGPGEAVEIRALIDHSVIEIYTAQGHTLTLRFYPTGDNQWRLSARARGFGEARLTLVAWALTPLSINV